MTAQKIIIWNSLLINYIFKPVMSFFSMSLHFVTRFHPAFPLLILEVPGLMSSWFNLFWGRGRQEQAILFHRCFLFQFLLTELPQHYSQSLLDSSSRISQSFPFNFLGFNAFCFYFLFFKVSFTFILAWTFISLQIKEFRIMGLSINDSVYSCVFFFLTGLHFFHLVVGLLLLSLLFWSCSL